MMINRGKALTVAVRALALALAAGGFQCIDKPMDPVMPRWDVDLSAPIADKSYSLAEIAEKDPDLLQAMPGSTQLMLKTSVEAQPTFVGDRITLDPISSSFVSQVGAFTIKSQPFTLPINIPGLTGGQSTIILPVPPTDIAAVNADVPFVESALLQSGTVTLRIQNRMPVAMRIETPVAVVNETGGVIGQFDFGTTPISAGGDRSVTADLAGITVKHRVRLQNLRVSSPGSGTSVVTIPDPMLVATITADNLVAVSATVSNIDPQHTQVTRTIALNTQTLVKDVWINRGTINFHFVSTVGIPSTLHLRVVELLTQSGQSYEKSFSLGARDSQDVTVDLAHYRLHDPANGFVRSLTAEVAADVAGSAGTYVTINATDYFAAVVASSSVVADSAIAVLKPTVIAIDQRIGLNLGEVTKKFKGSLNIPGANMRFTPHTSMSVPMELNLRLESRDKSGSTVTLQVPVTKGNMGLSAIDFAPGDVGNFLTQISGNIPDSLRVIGNVILNPDYDTTMPASIGRNSAFAGDVDLSVPMSLRITDGCFGDTLVMGDTTGDGNADHLLDPETMKSVNSGRMHVEIDNGLPMGVKVKLVLLDKARMPLLMIPQGEGDSVAIDAAIVVNGDVAASTHSSRILEIKGTEVTQFNNAVYVQMSVGIATPGTSAVNFRTTDRVRVRVWSEFSYRVNP
jgi:hypothetical protein